MNLTGEQIRMRLTEGQTEFLFRLERVLEGVREDERGEVFKIEDREVAKAWANVFGFNSLQPLSWGRVNMWGTLAWPRGWYFVAYHLPQADPLTRRTVYDYYVVRNDSERDLESEEVNGKHRDFVKTVEEWRKKGERRGEEVKRGEKG